MGRFVSYLWARPQANRYLRSFQVTVQLPSGISASANPFTAAGHGASMSITQSPSAGTSSVVGVSGLFKAAIPAPNRLYIGYLTLSVAGDSSGELSAPMDVRVDAIESVASASGTGGDSQINFQSPTASDYVYIGEPTRRRLGDGSSGATVAAHVLLQQTRPRRALQAPSCSLPGDANNDGFFNILDASAALAMNVARTGFLASGVGADPLESSTACEHQRSAMNPKFDRQEVPNVGWVAEVGLNDVAILERATQYILRILSVVASCVSSAGRGRFEITAFSPTSDGASFNAVKDEETSVYLHIVAASTTTNQQYTVSTGSRITTRTHKGATIDLYPQTYSQVPGHLAQEALVVQAVRDRSRSAPTWVVELEPSSGSGGASYYASVAAEVRPPRVELKTAGHDSPSYPPPRSSPALSVPRSTCCLPRRARVMLASRTMWGLERHHIKCPTA